MKPTYWIIAALVLVIGLGWYLWPEPQDFSESRQAYETEIAILKVEKAHISSRFDSLAKTSKHRGKSDSLKIARKDLKIQGLEKLSKEKRVKVETIIQDNPDLLSFVETQQEVIGELKELVDTLKESLAFQIRVKDELIQNHFAEERIDEQINEKKDQRIAQLEKQVKKERRGKRFWRFMSVLSLGGGAYGGSKLR